jgi:hypothetical protein
MATVDAGIASLRLFDIKSFIDSSRDVKIKEMLK